MNYRIGFGYDVHRLSEDRELWLGGIKIAANMRDIGYHFPDTSADTLDIDSKILLKKTIDLIAQKGYQLGNIDATVCAEKPKINPHIPAMKACMAKIMDTDEDAISIKATTSERMGFVGREEGMAAYATALIVKKEK